MDSWWQLGEGCGNRGQELDIFRITCPFCMESGNFHTAFHAEKKKSNSDKKLNFDTLECGNCKGYVMVLWSASEYSSSRGIYAYHVLPWPLEIKKYPDHWPEAVGRYWLQAKWNISNENWDAAVLMTRSALQVALRERGAKGKSLKEDINNLATQGLLPPIMKEWADQVRELGNESAHPDPAQAPPDRQDAMDILRFLDFLLEYLYSLPHQIQQYRERQ